MTKKQQTGKKKTTTTAVATPASNELPTELLDIYTEDAELGNEEVGAEDVSTPFLKCLQKMSDEVDEDSEGYIEGAEPGMFLDTVTQDLYSGEPEEGPLVIPCHYQRRWVEWTPREEGGGFIRQWEAGEVPINAKRGDIHVSLEEEGTECILTHYHFVLLVNEETNEAMPIVIPMTSTNLSQSAKWNTKIRSQQIPGGGGRSFPRFAHAYRLSALRRENDKGSWYVFKPIIERRLDLEEEADHNLYMQAKTFHQIVSKDGVALDRGQEEDAKQPGMKEAEDTPF